MVASSADFVIVSMTFVWTIDFAERESKLDGLQELGICVSATEQPELTGLRLLFVVGGMLKKDIFSKE